MTYEMLARKWRPQTFDEVVGQEHITGTLKKAVESGRISHAYLFSGPRGCGKTSTARILAKVINCVNLSAGNPCNACDSCSAVARGNNLDVMEIDGASHTGVAEVRDLQESIGYAPSQFSNKVYIIDEVHMLSTHAFNALLKTLEEPPAHVYFVFATTAPHKIPDTIKSRCQRHQFKRLEVTEIVAQLETICRAEKVESETEALRLLARKSEGSMRDAESLLDQVITASSGRVRTTEVRQILGLLDQEMVGRFLKSIADRDATAVLRGLDAAVQEGVDLEELLGALVEGFRDLMLLATPGDLSELVYRSKDEVEKLRELLPSLELGDLVTFVERLCNLSFRLKMVSDPRVLMESALVDLALIDRQTNIRDLINTLEGSGAQGDARASRAAGDKPRGRASEALPFRVPSSAGVPKPLAATMAGAPPEPTAAAAVAGFDASLPAGGLSLSDAGSSDEGDFRKRWDGFVTQVRQRKVALGVCLVQGVLKSFDEKTVVVRFAKSLSYQREQIEDPVNRKFLKAALGKYFGRDMDLVCVADDNGEADGRPSGSADAHAEPAADEAIESRPLVKKILTDFDGEIVRHYRS
jgi:DNA polymerase-3 subunit gamma/tau